MKGMDRSFSTIPLSSSYHRRARAEILLLQQFALSLRIKERKEEGRTSQLMATLIMAAPELLWSLLFSHQSYVCSL